MAGHGPSNGRGKPPPLTDEQRTAVSVTETFLRENVSVTAVVSPVDMDQLFMLFAGFCGDLKRTSYASGVKVEDLVRYADDGKWMERIRGLIELKQFDTDGSIERGISRAYNFVQMNRYRMIIDKIVRDLARLTQDQLMARLCSKVYYSDGTLKSESFSTKYLADLATAMEKVHWMSYQATMDSAQDRVGRREKTKDDGPGEEDIHAKIAKALTSTPALSPERQVQDAQEQQHAPLNKVMAAVPPLPTPLPPPLPPPMLPPSM